MLRKTLVRNARYAAYQTASMRPQRNAAENILSDPLWPADGIASMRPQRNAAENTPPAFLGPRGNQSFNEAAA